MLESILGLIEEIKKTEEAGALTAAVSMSFVLMDTLTYLGMTEGKTRQGKQDFIDWVDAHLKSHEDQPYKYAGLDVYGARCAMLHVYGSEASFHDENPDAKIFGYHDGGKHIVDLDGEKLVLIGVQSFINDVLLAARSFVQSCMTDAPLRERVAGRLPGLMRTINVDSSKD